jgi:hypothetical protein
MRIIKKGATSQSVYVEILDATSSTGARKTGLVYNTASLTAYYARNGASATAITLATLAAANSAWSSGGFKEVDATNMPGLYRLDVPDAAVASGVDSVVVTIRGATGMSQVSTEIQLTAIDLQDTAQIPTSVMDLAAGVETGWTLRQAMRIVLSAMAGKASGLGTTTAVFRDMADSKDRISATVDTSGNRSAVTRDAT